MVYFCCVNGCRKNDRKDPDVSFHAFPLYTNLKRQWLKAIGRPNWNPPSYARVCGAHFVGSKPGLRTGIYCPVNILQTHSEATEDDVCYFCLNYDVKMYSLEDETLKMCYKSVVKLNKSLEGLPKFICYECKANLLKCYNFIQKIKKCRATIKEIFEEHGQINKIVAKSKNRERLNLKSSLRRNFVTPTHLFEYTFDEDRGTSQLTKVRIIEIAEEKDKSCTNIENCYREDEKNIKIDTSNGGRECKLENQCESDDNCNIFNENNDFIFNNAGVGHDHDYSILTKEDNSDNREPEFMSVSQIKIEIEEEVGNTEKNNENSPDASAICGDDNNDDTDNENDDEIDELEAFFKSMKAENLEPLKANHEQKAKNIKKKYEKEEKEMEKTFNIVKLSLQEQKEQFKKSIEIRRKQTHDEYRCDTCFKVFLTLSACKKHVYLHDPDLRGLVECPVCLLRFRTREYLWIHSYSYHDHVYQCKSCPYSVNNRGRAAKHARDHAAGYKASCPLCPFKGKHPSSVTNHVRTLHKEQAHKCAICDLLFISTMGLRLHMSSVHPEDSNKMDYSCEKCGINFKSEDDKLTHLRTSPAHSDDKDVEVNSSSAINPAKRNKPGAGRYNRIQNMKSAIRHGYPKKCDHCDLKVSNRFEHWQHVRIKHRDKVDTYRPIVRVVCDVCGRGLRNRTQLEIHLLKHGPPTFACAHCPRKFHDKYALARHVVVHLPDLPYRCDQCPSAFKQLSNLIRHKSVHSDVAPYECKICFKRMKYPHSHVLHMRRVHGGMPHPQRKKRTLKKKKEE